MNIASDADFALGMLKLRDGLPKITRIGKPFIFFQIAIDPKNV
jgi:hypothetical protein